MDITKPPAWLQELVWHGSVWTGMWRRLERLSHDLARGLVNEMRAAEI